MSGLDAAYAEAVLAGIVNTSLRRATGWRPLPMGPPSASGPKRKGGAPRSGCALPSARASGACRGNGPPDRFLILLTPWDDWAKKKGSAP